MPIDIPHIIEIDITYNCLISRNQGNVSYIIAQNTNNAPHEIGQNKEQGQL